MGPAHCLICGEPVKAHLYSKKIKGHGIVEKVPAKHPGWSHEDGMRRDHDAIPHDGRSLEGETIRAEAVADQAMAEVKGHLQEQFDYRNAEQRVNDVFKDRRGRG